jgi:phage/plasmid-like protein (TIGR03299 family)
MAHEFESGFFVQAPAWHGLGTVLEECPATSAQALTIAGLDWTVETRNMFAAPVGEGAMIPIVGNRAIVRTSDNSVLGVVGNQYDPIQNVKAFEFFDAFIETGSVSYEAAGSLRNGQVIWILAKIQGLLNVRQGDNVEKYLLLYNSHDGSVCLNVHTTPIRVVCMNTLQAAKVSNKGKSSLKLKHTKTVNSRLDAAIEALKVYNAQFDETLSMYQFLASKRVNQELLEQFLDLIFPLPKEREGGRNRQIRELVSELFNGRQLGGSEGSFWDLYNSVTEYADHWSANKNQDTRFQSILMGTLAAKKDEAFQLCLNMAQSA